MRGLSSAVEAEKGSVFPTICAVCERDLTNEPMSGVQTTAGFQRLCQTEPAWTVRDCFTQVCDLTTGPKAGGLSFEEFSANVLDTIAEMSAVNIERRRQTEERNARWEEDRRLAREAKNAETVTLTLGRADFEELLDELADIPAGEIPGLDVLRTIDYLSAQGAGE